MDRTPKQVQDLTLALLYLTSLEDHDDPASRRCWKGYDFQTLADLQAQGLVEDTQGRIPLRLPPQGIAQAKASRPSGIPGTRPRPCCRLWGWRIPGPNGSNRGTACRNDAAGCVFPSPRWRPSRNWMAQCLNAPH